MRRLSQYAENNAYIHRINSGEWQVYPSAKNWPSFTWREDKLQQLLNEGHLQGHLLGKMELIGFGLRAEATLQTITTDILKSGEIEGELLDAGQVRSSVAKDWASTQSPP